MEETKEADPSLIEMDNVREMTNPHGDMGCGGKTQTTMQTQCNILSMTKDWDVNVLNHVLVQVLEKDAMDPIATNDFVSFLMCKVLTTSCSQ